MRSKGFTSTQQGIDSGLFANLKRQIACLKREVQNLKAVNAMNMQRMSEACSQVAEMRRQLNLYNGVNRQLFQGKSGHLEFLEQHVMNLRGNYPDACIPTYLQMAQVGENAWNLLVDYLGFPSWRTVQRWRASFLEHYQLSRDILDGEVVNLDYLFSTYFGNDYKGKGIRVVLSVDAAGASPRVIVHKNGHIEGFVNHDAAIDPEEAQKLRSSLSQLRSFVAAHHRDIVKDFFVVLVCPLESNSGGFPIFLYPKTNGSADPVFVSKFVQVIQNVQQTSIDVVGIGCDGDAGYLQFVRGITQHLNIVDLGKPLSHQNVPHLLVFEDMLHLAKCVRYRFICGSRICPYPYCDETVSIQDFEAIGIAPWVIDSSPVRKMDDFLPLMMFTEHNVIEGLKCGKPGVSLALLPVTLLIAAVMTSELTRTERLDYLSRAWGFFWCYKQACVSSLPSIPQHAQTKMKGQNLKMAIYDQNTLDKSISLCYALSRIIADPRAVHLGALGTHWLEHFFGNIRRLCMRNDCPANFERSLLMIMLQKAISGREHLKTNRSRLSDSGVILPPEPVPQCLPSMPLGSFIFEAAMILQLDPRKLQPSARAMVLTADQFPKRPVDPQFLLRSMVKGEIVETDCGSTRSSRMTDVGGLTTRKRDIMAGQI